MIPRILHVIWVGDESKRPDRFIQTWRDHHPGWTFKLWGNRELNGRTWVNGFHMAQMAKREWNGVADMMRWEILHEQGGILVDADSACVRPMPEWLMECEAFACWESELLRPGLVAAGYFGTIPGTPFVQALIDGIRRQPTVTDRMAWQSVGPHFLTETWKVLQYVNLTILPSHFFIPRHFAGLEYTGGGPIYAAQAWGSTLGIYEALARDLATAPAELPTQAASQAFLFEPAWEDPAWAELLLSYLETFTVEDRVALVLVMDPAHPRQVALADAEQAVLEVVAQTGRETFPSVLLVDSPSDLIQALRPYAQMSWIPPRPGVGLRGTYGTRLAQTQERRAKALPAQA